MCEYECWYLYPTRPGLTQDSACRCHCFGHRPAWCHNCKHECKKGVNGWCDKFELIEPVDIKKELEVLEIQHNNGLVSDKEYNEQLLSTVSGGYGPIEINGELKTKINISLIMPTRFITDNAAIVEHMLDSLTYEQKENLFKKYCKHCGDKNPRCQCWNDE